MIKHLLATIIIVFLFPFVVYGQNSSSRQVDSSSMMDIRDWLGKKGIGKKTIENNKFLFVVPVIGVNPANGFIYGGGLAYVYKSENCERFSTMSSNASYSTKKLLNLNVRSNLFILKDKLFLNGDWQYFIITESTYGLGGVPDSMKQSLRYNHIRIHETASWNFFPNFFAGLGVHYDQYSNIKDNTSSYESYNYRYSTQHGFDPKESVTSGISLNALFDSRDNPVNTYKGYYANINYRVNETVFGSTKNSTMLLTDYRVFYPLDVNERHILAFWFYGSFVVSGDVPYLLLPAIGYDQRQRTGRGYAFGRFRGEDLVYAESEYRFPISTRTGILSGVLFANCTSTSDKENNIALLNYLWPAYGTGLRIMLDKQSRTRLDFDVAIGDNKIGFYLAIRETF